MTGLSWILRKFTMNPENLFGEADTVAGCGSIEHDLVDMCVETEKCRHLLNKVAWLYDRNDAESKKYSSVVKLAIPESAIKALNRSIDILGGYGYMRDQGLGGALRDVRITSIYEGTSKIQKNAISKILY